LEEEFKNTKTDRELFGVFREEKSINAGDPFIKPPPKVAPRHAGKQFGVPYQPKGSGPDAMIDKTTKLTIPGDMYTDQFDIQRALEKRDGKPISSKPFVPAHPAPKSAGSGDLYGIFGRPKELLDTDPSTAAKGLGTQKSEADKRKKIYASPAKFGTFGYPVQDRTIGGTRFDYIPDEYAPGRNLDRKLKAEARAKFTKPFVSTGRTGKGITPIPYNTVPGPEKRSIDFRSSSADASRKPWRQTNPPAKGPGYGTINKLVYIPDPVKEPQYTPRDAPKPKGFKPAGSSHTRLSMWSVNPYAYEARPPANNDLALLN